MKLNLNTKLLATIFCFALGAISTHLLPLTTGDIAPVAIENETAKVHALASPWLMFACSGSSPALTALDTGNVVTNGTNLSACITSAVLGDTITVTGGATYQGPFTFGDKGAGSAFITITSSIPTTAGVQVSPASLGSMAKLTTPTTESVLTFNADAHHWKFIDIAITTATSYPTTTAAVGSLVSGGSATYGHWPHDLTFDRCLVYPPEVDPMPFRSAREGFILDGANITITESDVYNFGAWEFPNASQALTTASNASPVTVTWGTPIGDPGNNHKYLVFLSGATGSWAPLNGLQLATYVDSTHATLQSMDSSFNLTNIDSSGFGSYSGQTINRITNTSNAAWTGRALTLINGPGPYTAHNSFFEGYYTQIFTGGGDVTWVPPGNDVTVSSVTDLNTVVLSGLGNLQVGDLIAFASMQPQTIVTATAGNPTILTVQATRNPGTITNYNPEGCVSVSGFTGSWAPLNANWGGGNNSSCSGSNGVVTWTDSTHMTIPRDSTGFGAVTASSPQWTTTTKNSGSGTQWQVARVTAIDVPTKTVTTQFWGHQPDNGSGNGNGLLVAAGSRALFNGRTLDGLTITNNTLSVRKYWIELFRDVANTCYNCSGQTPKAVWEAKMGTNVLVEGNFIQIEGGDVDGFSTVSFGVNQANQIGATPWINVNNWVVRNNVFKNYTYLKISFQEEFESGQLSSGFSFTNNVMTTSKASFMNFEGGDGFTVSHNTVRNTGGHETSGGGWFIAVFGGNTNSVVQDNIGMWCNDGYSVNGTWTKTRDHNYYIDNFSNNCSSSLPAGDFCRANDAAMGFVNIGICDSGADFHGCGLTVGSIGHNADHTGTKDVGVDLVALDIALAGGSPPVTRTANINGKFNLKGKAVIKYKAEHPWCLPGRWMIDPCR